jgi:hypothetical protein
MGNLTILEGVDDGDAPLTAEQAALNKMLVRGIVFSVVWLAGFGSAIALYQGLRARRIIRLNPLLRGSGRAWWCIIAGALGVGVLCTVIASGIYNALTQP